MQKSHFKMRICEQIASIKPYISGKPISDLQREQGLNNIIKLASNENPNPINTKTRLAIINNLEYINRYPDSNGFSLKQALAKHLNIISEQIILGNGSNDILELIARIFVCNSNDEVIFSEYAFIVYPLITKALNAKAIITPSANYGHNLDAMLTAITNKTKLIFIANPNNPTGTFVNFDKIYNFLLSVPNNIIVVLDEAYYEYISDDYQTLSLINKFDNLIITRTFSKAYGLAGLRCGYGIANIEIIDYINRIRQPFNVNSLAQIAAIVALEDKKTLEFNIKQNKKGLIQLYKGFEKLALKYIESKANFVSVFVGDADNIYNKLLVKGIITRPVEMQGFIRVSVGLEAENKALLSNLKQIIC